MDSLKLDTSCTALILVDLQRGIVGMPTRPYSGSFVVEKGASLAAATPSNNSLSGRRAARSRASRCKATSPGSGK
jgi:hypothetical protein